ncbi:aryl-alcohol dehydrogenase [Stipitochalara longipes BDJ]|nr:aryl-alcohol dehydrogenase [Stipitochalara longipes BDJ]
MVVAKALVVPELHAPFQLVEIELDSLRADEVLVELKATSICATDPAVQHGKIPLKFPVVLGHEGAGIVKEIGTAVSDLAVGDHVVLSYNSCGKCRHCQKRNNFRCVEIMKRNFGGKREDGSQTLTWEGKPVSSCFFGQSSFCNPAVVQANSCVKVDSSLDLAVVCSLGCGVQTGAGSIFNVVKPVENDIRSLGIFGLGAVGCAAVMAANIISQDNPQVLSQIIAVDVNESRLELAKDLGATHTINPEKEDVRAKLSEITGQEGLDAAVDCSGVLSVINTMIESIGAGGIAVTIGNPGNESKASIPILPFIAGAKTYCASHQGNADSKSFIPRLASLHQQGRLPINRLQKTYSAENINEAIADMKSGSVIKPVLLWA